MKTVKKVIICALSALYANMPLAAKLDFEPPALHTKTTTLYAMPQAANLSSIQAIGNPSLPEVSKIAQKITIPPFEQPSFTTIPLVNEPRGNLIMDYGIPMALHYGGIPFITSSYLALKLALYPYLWYRSGIQEATKEACMTGLGAGVTGLTGRNAFISCPHGGLACKFSNWLVTVFASALVRQKAVSPLVEKFFGAPKSTTRLRLDDVAARMTENENQTISSINYCGKLV